MNVYKSGSILSVTVTPSNKITYIIIIIDKEACINFWRYVPQLIKPLQLSPHSMWKTSSLWAGLLAELHWIPWNHYTIIPLNQVWDLFTYPKYMADDIIPDTNAVTADSLSVLLVWCLQKIALLLVLTWQERRPWLRILPCSHSKPQHLPR